jgi:hypothetical protein
VEIVDAPDASSALVKNLMHEELIRDGFSKVDLTSRDKHRIWTEGHFTKWVKKLPNGMVQKHYAVCEVTNGRCRQ